MGPLPTYQQPTEFSTVSGEWVWAPGAEISPTSEEEWGGLLREIAQWKNKVAVFVHLSLRVKIDINMQNEPQAPQ